MFFFFFSSRRRHTRYWRDWSSDVCSSDLLLAASSRMLFTQLRQGKLLPVPPVEAALQFFAYQGLAPDAMPPGRRVIVGSPERVRRDIEALAAEYEADEVMIVTITYDHAARRRSYELVAQAFGIE